MMYYGFLEVIRVAGPYECPVYTTTFYGVAHVEKSAVKPENLPGYIPEFSYRSSRLSVSAKGTTLK